MAQDTIITPVLKRPHGFIEYGKWWGFEYKSDSIVSDTIAALTLKSNNECTIWRGDVVHWKGTKATYDIIGDSLLRMTDIVYHYETEERLPESLHLKVRIKSSNEIILIFYDKTILFRKE